MPPARSPARHCSARQSEDGVSLDQARAEMQIVAQIEREFPRTNTRIGANIIGLRDEISQQSRLLLLGLVAASVAVLLIACTNLANLFLTKALARQRLVRQMFTESLLLASIGGVAGTGLAIAVVPFVARLVPTTLPIAETPGLDWRMLGAAAVATLATAIGFGVIPALRVGRHADASALVVAEVTMSVVLLVCTGLLVRALWNVQQVDPGFTPDGVLTLRTALPLPKYQATARKHLFFDRVLDEETPLHLHRPSCCRC